MEELVRLSLKHPVRLFVDSNMDVADNLRQEFVRIKSKKEGDREAIVTGEQGAIVVIQLQYWLLCVVNRNTVYLESLTFFSYDNVRL